MMKMRGFLCRYFCSEMVMHAIELIMTLSGMKIRVSAGYVNPSVVVMARTFILFHTPISRCRIEIVSVSEVSSHLFDSAQQEQSLLG